MHYKRKILVTMVALALSGCGSGGGNDKDPTSGVSGVSLDGTVAKGIVKGGNVVAEELASNGSVLRQIGSATTDASGNYSIDVSNDYEGGPIQVTITSDTNTEMKCDIPIGCGTRSDGIFDTSLVIDFGEWYKPGDFTMTALVAEAAKDDQIAVNITPYTDLAARNAKATGNIDAAAIYNANSAISNLLGGIDILNTKPLDITDAAALNGGTPIQIAYAAFGAAIAALADASGGNPNLTAALEKLAASLASGKIAADDSGSSDDDDKFSLKEILDGSSAVFGHVGVTDNTGVLDDLQGDIDDAEDTDGDGVADLEAKPSDSAGDATLTKVKTFVSDLRTWGNVVNLEAETKADQFDMQVDMASSAAELSMDYVVGPAMEAAITAALVKFDLGTAEADQLTSELYIELGFTAGTIANNNGVYTITGGVVNGVTVNMSVSIPVDGAAISTATIGITSATFSSAVADATINEGSVTVTLSEPYTIDYAAIDLGEEAPLPEITSLVLDLDFSITQKKNVEGDNLAANVSFAGALETTLVNPVTDVETGDILWMTPSTLSLDGAISSSAGHSFEASFTANIHNAEDFVPYSEEWELEGAGDNQWLEATIGLSFALALDGLPEAIISITGDRSAVDAGTANVTISYGTRKIEVNGSVSSSVETLDDVVITNQDNVKLTIEPGNQELMSGEVLFNGNKYADVTKLSNGLVKITYIDGTFESF